ncbi:TetR family transcriptional regulator [Enemella evansiae]|uniref:TetR family transcriptional regulator n=1 Tax=Enemella evansiae TaxID=2016499 RepID=A0A255G7V8_9ACTN|nr:TetR/AcrR family transcriptional regulator [Enemella evansiae]OYO11532.1 TetR family transcriptional regulator [Enemella evansiae]
MPAALTAERIAADRQLLLDAAESLIYAEGFRAVGMDRVREASGLSLKRIYALHPTKDELVVAMLRRRDQRWRGALTARVETADDPVGRVLAVFDWLADWFAEPGFRGCLWINLHGELADTSPAVRAEVLAHKQAFREQLTSWAGEVDPATLDAIQLLVEGAIVTAGIDGDLSRVRSARAAAARLLAD